MIEKNEETQSEVKDPKDEESMVRALIHRSISTLAFPRDLERKFRVYHTTRAVEAFRFASAYLALLALIVGVVGFVYLDKLESGAWAIGYAGLLGGLLTAMAMAKQPRFDQYQPLYTIFAGVTCIVSGFYAINFSDDVAVRRFANYQFIYVLFVFYSIGRLRTIVAIGSSVLAGLICLLMVFLYGSTLTWLEFIIFYVLGNLSCCMVNFLLEHASRTNFLQNQLLEIEKKRLDEFSRKLEILSSEDSLTKLANRRHFDEFYKTEWHRCLRDQKPLSVLLIDVDFFKDYNDNYGHIKGDQCLAMVAKTLSEQAFRTTDLVARYGGEEFAMICPNTEYASARYIAQRIIHSIDLLNIQHETSLVAKHITVSIGVASMVPTQESSRETLLEVTDRALYKAKGSGRHRAFVEKVHV